MQEMWPQVQAWEAGVRGASGGAGEEALSC